MPQIDPQLSTGIFGLDRLFTGLIPGDNIVFRVAAIEDYAPFVTPYCENALRRGERLIYFWSDNIDPESGVLRLVFGLGTRAVDRHDDDYTRVVALNEPGRRPESGWHDIRRYSQRKVDVIDLGANHLCHWSRRP